MISKSISYEELKKAIDAAFEDDHEIVGMYDPSQNVSNLSEVSDNIYKKLFELKDIVECKGVYSEKKLIGYYVFIDSLLISFALNKELRVPQHLNGFFKLIKKDLGDLFVCRLWDSNMRGIKWLVKNDMQIVDIEKNIVTLIFKK